jgi:hypothetical protein
MGVLLPDRLEAIVAHACAADPRERFQTARQMLDALEAAGRETTCLARHTEVAEYIERLAGSELRERREAINKQRLLVESTADKTEESAAPRISSPSQPAWRKSWVTADLGDSGVVELEESLAPRRSRGKLVALAAIALAIVGGALGLALSGNDDEERAHAPENSAQSPTSALTQPAPESLPTTSAPEALDREAAPAATPQSAPTKPKKGHSSGVRSSGSKRGGAPDKLNQISTTNPYRQRAPQ